MDPLENEMMYLKGFIPNQICWIMTVKIMILSHNYVIKMTNDMTKLYKIQNHNLESLNYDIKKPKLHKK